MGGYANFEDKQPFIMIGGRKWFVTGDLVKRDAEGYYTFVSRLERSVKMGGEMVPLDGVEETLSHHNTFAPTKEDKGPILAIEATPVEVNPELVLFTTRDLTREQANAILRAAGVSKTVNIRKVVKVPEIPMLGTGKIDRKPLRELLKDPKFVQDDTQVITAAPRFIASPPVVIEGSVPPR